MEVKFDIKPKDKELKKGVAFQMDISVHNWIQNRAKATGISMTNLIKQMLSFAISCYEWKDKNEETIEANNAIPDNKELEEVPALQGQEPTLD